MERVNSKASRPVPLLIPGAIALLAGLWAALIRLGWDLPSMPGLAPGLHGPLMVGGFLGTLIGLERALALAERTGQRWPYLAPLLSGLGGLALILAGTSRAGPALVTLGSAALVAILIVICRLQLDWPHGTMGLGAAALLVGNLLWLLGAPIPHAAAWWIGFVVLTIAGERLELARFVTQRPGALRSFAAVAALYLGGLVLSLSAFTLGLRVAGAGLVLLGLWLLRHDLARRTIRQTGLTRYIAACLLPGYAWLVFAGGLWMAGAGRFDAGPLYDAMLHVVLVGFVFSMIFGHAPIILPAVTGAPVAYAPRFYSHLALLHLSLLLRVVADIAGLPGPRQWGGLLNVVAILLFLANTVTAGMAAGRRRPAAAGGP